MDRPSKSFPENAPGPADPCGALYVHVPVCRRRCAYCDFFSLVADADLAAGIADGLVAELHLRAGALAGPARTAFVGGGTPTALAPQDLQRVLAAVADHTAAGAEFTVEANPTTLTDQMLAILARAGVNRLSVGVQSFDDRELAVLGRTHSAAQAREALNRAAAAGFSNLSLDLIYGTPGQSLASWAASLAEAVASPATHISFYNLSYPDATPLARAVDEGRLTAMDEDLQRDCYELAIDALAAAGFEHYEISNAAKGGQRCLHNLTYWHNRSYLGIGPSAASCLDGRRSTNVADVEVYLRHIRQGDVPEAAAERLTGAARAAETLMLALRLTEGVGRADFRRRFGLDPLDAFSATFDRYRRAGLL
ncbi:MAG: radical SAM family heme chaperone HemW, partial [Planctomycetes bacterium]|nr:radical SAM family heme chaperone HemW [Planctomycetota bacterium]